MRFAHPPPTKPVKPEIPLWHRDLIAQKVRRFRTENAAQYFDVLNCASGAALDGAFYISALERGRGGAGEWIFSVMY